MNISIFLIGFLLGIILGCNLFIWLTGKLVLSLSDLIGTQNDLLTEVSKFLLDRENAI